MRQQSIFPGTQPCIRQQHFGTRNCFVKLYSASVVCDYHDFERGTPDYRIYHLRKEFGVKTVYTSVMLPVFIGLFEILFPDFGSMTDSQELDVLCYILVVSVGLSILFNRNASSGGLDIVAKS